MDLSTARRGGVDDLKDGLRKILEIWNEDDDADGGSRAARAGGTDEMLHEEEEEAEEEGRVREREREQQEGEEEEEGERWVEGALGEEVDDDGGERQTAVDDEPAENGQDDGVLRAQPPPWLRIKREAMVGMDMEDD